MKRFLIRTIAFTCLFVGVLFILNLILPYNPDGYMREYFVKTARLDSTDRNKVVILGGSNVAFGYDSKLLTDSLNRPVINAGLHAGLGQKFIVDDASRYLERGDILVLSPEYEHFFAATAYGGHPLADIFYLSDGRVAPLLDMKQWSTVLENTPFYLKEKVRYTATAWALKRANHTQLSRMSAFNEYGDMVAHWPDSLFHYVAPAETSSTPQELNADYLLHFVQQVKEVKKRGVDVVLYPPSVAVSYLHSHAADIQSVDSAFTTLGIPFVCRPGECSFPDSLLYNTHYHLGHRGAQMHTLHLLHLLRDKDLADSGN